ncbi:MAG: NAD(P)/FAD-dependent oxidoreductase [Nitrospirota bacterium]
MKTSTYDAIVVGGGPAGASAAYEIAAAGRTVLVLERERFPRYKVCGGGLSARLDRVIGTVYHETVEASVRGMEFVYRGAEAFSVDADGPLARFVMRDRFDAWLADRAAAAGADVRYGEPAIEVREEADSGVHVRTARGAYQARCLVGADGAHSRLAKRLNPDHALRGVYGLEAEVSGAAAPPRAVLEMGAVPGGYGWVFPKRRGVSVGVAGFYGAEPRPKQRYHLAMERQPALREQAIPPPIGHPIPVFTATFRVASQRIGLVGDAARLVDPFFGEGIYFGVLSGQHLGRTIGRQLANGAINLHEYEQWVRNALAPELAVTARLAAIAYGHPRLWYDAMRAHPEVVGWMYDVLRGESSFRALWSRLKRHAIRLAPAAVASRVSSLFMR